MRRFFPKSLLGQMLLSVALALLVAQAISAVLQYRAAEQRRELWALNGLAFQLVDDVLDYGSEQDVMGKAAGDDFRDGKVTLPVILAYARGSEDERSFWRSAMAGERASDEDLERAIGLLRGSEALSETLGRARQYGRRALDALAGFPSSKAKSALSEAVEFAISRAY